MIFIFISPINLIQPELMGTNQPMAYVPNHSNAKIGGYGYATNNPIRNIDATGTQSFTDAGPGLDGIFLPGSSSCSKWWNPFTWFKKCK